LGAMAGIVTPARGLCSSLAPAARRSNLASSGAGSPWRVCCLRRRCVAPQASKTTGGKKRDDKSKQATRKSRNVTKYPVLARLIDGPLILGDAVMIAATEFSSQRIPWTEDTKWLLCVAVLSWFTAGVILGDYRGQAPYNDNLYVQLVLGPIFIGVLDCTVTWAVASVLGSLGYAILVNHNVIDPTWIMDGLGTDDLSPQLEVGVAALIIMPCWRGMALKLRYR